jgi:tetratricopeptide (TPR) repeat protein
MVLQIVSAAVFVIVGSVFLWTYISLIKLLLTFILTFPLDLMFPAIAHDAQYWCNKGFTFSDHGQHQKAVRCFGKALEVDSNRFLAWCNTGTSEYNLDRRTAAMHCYQRVLASVAAQTQSDPRVMDLIGRCRERLQQLEHQ